MNPSQVSDELSTHIDQSIIYTQSTTTLPVATPIITDNTTTTDDTIPIQINDAIGTQPIQTRVTMCRRCLVVSCNIITNPCFCLSSAIILAVSPFICCLCAHNNDFSEPDLTTTEMCCIIPYRIIRKLYNHGDTCVNEDDCCF